MTSNIQSKFVNWYFNEFRHEPLYIAMAETIENSQWHREASVAIHTDMVVTHYLQNCTDDTFDIRAALVCVFHDVGKPSAEETLVKEDGTTYRRYAGHELASARCWDPTASRVTTARLRWSSPTRPS